MDSISNYKNRALASLQDRWTNPVICALVYILIVIAWNLISGPRESVGIRDLIAFVLYFGLIPLGWSLATMFLGFVRGNDVKTDSLFLGFKKPWFPKTLLLMLLVGIYTVLWTLLLIIPGIIKAYSYSMTPYILRDNAEVGYDEAITESMRLMDGHKMQLFLLDLSFIGWALLSILTLGIGFIWLTPYMYTARAHFYEDLKREQA